MYIVLVLVAVAAMFLITKVARTVYHNTGVNTLRLPNKALWYVEIFAAVAAVSAESVLLVIVAILVCAGLQFLLSFKAGVVNAVVIALLHAAAGPVIGLVNLFQWCLSLFAGRKVAGIGGLFSISASAEDVRTFNDTAQQQAAAQAARAEAERQAQIAAADAYARHQGFRSAEEAERTYGIKTGLPR